jgi:hypothetical protein
MPLAGDSWLPTSLRKGAEDKANNEQKETKITKGTLTTESHGWRIDVGENIAGFFNAGVHKACIGKESQRWPVSLLCWSANK